MGSFGTVSRLATGSFPLDPATVGRVSSLDGSFPDYNLPHNHQIEGGYSDALLLTGWTGGTVPAESTINGVKATIYKMKDTPDHPVADGVVQLIVGGALVGSNKASLTDYSTSVTATEYGSPSDLWGASLIAADFSSTFGILVSVLNPTWEYPVTPSTVHTLGYIDYVTVEVFFTESASGGSPFHKVYHLDGGSDYCNNAFGGPPGSCVSHIPQQGASAYPLTVSDMVTWEKE